MQSVEGGSGDGDRVGMAGGVHDRGAAVLQGGADRADIGGVSVRQAQRREARSQRGGRGSEVLGRVGGDRQGIDVQTGGPAQVGSGGLQGRQDHGGGQRAEIGDGGCVGEQCDAVASAGGGVDAARIEEQMLDDAVVCLGVQERPLARGAAWARTAAG